MKHMTRINPHLRSLAFTDYIRRACAQARASAVPQYIRGKSWEALMFRALQTTDPSAPLWWDPKSNRSGIDIAYDGAGYSLKTTTLRTPLSKIAHLHSYKMARCHSDKDAIAEIDRPHRHNFEWYSILVNSAAVDSRLYVLSANLTLACRFDWDYSDGRLTTDVKNGVRLEIYKKNEKRMLMVHIDFTAPQIKEGCLI